MLFLTAYTTETFSEIGELCSRSVRHHLSKIGKHHFTAEIIPADYPRLPSWYKVDAIRRHLPQHDVVLWLDADAMVIGERDLLPLIGKTPLSICRDSNGINHGVAAWRNTPEAFTALRLMDHLYPTYQCHRWFEQAALMSFIDLLPHTTLPKHILNAYQGEITLETQIAHFPGTTNDRRIQLMRELAKQRNIP